MRTVLVVAAEARELSDLVRRCGGRDPGWPVEFARVTERNGQRWAMVANGPAKLAGEAVDVAAARVAVDAMVSTGVCGALDPELGVGEVFIASRVSGDGDGERFETVRPPGADRFRSGVILSTGCVVASVEEKRRLFAAGAAAVEMEAAIVAARARERGVPFYCVRAVMDRADEGFSLDFDELIGPDGRFSRLRILRAALARPWVALPELIRLARQSSIAARALGEFLAECRF